MNVRYFQTSGGKHWFGGGIDATPIYIQKGEAVSFHQLLKSVCDRFPSHSYLKYKTWADRYFYLKHREETRGIGGIFFDHLAADDEPTKQMNWEFVQEVAAAFVPAYESLAQPNRLKAYGERELEWQALRRSRYVEFNLLWDKGTRFGLDSDGRTESILMSMPPEAKWVYNHNPLPDSPEADTLLHLKPTEWLGVDTKHGLEKAYRIRQNTAQAPHSIPERRRKSLL
jgi:coproporphyrinogen III oxidase